jgi:hypothetical protein
MTQQQPESGVICVLGMHRSGTSCLMGSMQEAGLHLGKHHTWNRYNRKGNRENQDIVDLNDDILQYSGGSWDDPPAKLRFTAEHLQRARDLIASFPADMRWGFKDPRALLTLPLWREVLGANHARIGIFRHPLAVANSLAFREGTRVMPEARALSIWQQYNSCLLAEYKRKRFPILCFDWDEAVFHDKLDQAHQLLGLPILEPEQRFYVSGLKNYESRDLSIIPWKYRQLYKRLRSIAL